MDGPPPPPPPHGTNPKTTAGSGGLPPGNYDIFIIPPHSSGGGFLYLPSLQVQRNSFLAGVASTLAGIAVWKTVEPTVKQWSVIVSQSVSTSGNGVVLLVALFAVLWALKLQWEAGAFGGGGGSNSGGPGNGPRGGPGAGASGANYQRAPPQPPPHGSYPGAGSPPPQGAHGGWQGQGQGQQRGAPPPQDNESWSGSQPDPDARAGWDKAREETRKREEERKRAEEERKKAEEERKRAEEERKRAEEAAQKKREEERKAKEEADRLARAKAEKEKWEKMRAREREQREREARERIARERAQREKEAKEREEKERLAREAEAREKMEKEIRERVEAEQRKLREKLEAEQREMREKLEAEQRAKAAEEAAKKAAEEKAAREAAAAKAKADAERAERLKAARERAQREREAREARVKAEAEKLKTQAQAPPIDITGARRSTTYGGIGGGERLDPYAGVRSPPTPSVTSAQSSPIKATVTPKKNYEKPSAKSYVGTEDEHSFRPYDRPPKPPSHASSYTASSYAPSQSTARTTPPPSQRGPYSTNDPDKIQIKAVYLFNDLFPKPVAQLVANVGKVTDGLILKIQSEGLFIDDDVRSMPQREWDVKAWTLKLVETGQNPSKGLHILRACVRDADGKKYVFLIDESESWKLAIGLQRLRKGSQVRSLQNNQMAPGEIARILNSVPPVV